MDCDLDGQAWSKLEKNRHIDGYRDGYTAGCQVSLQNGFNDGLEIGHYIFTCFYQLESLLNLTIRQHDVDNELSSPSTEDQELKILLTKCEHLHTSFRQKLLNEELLKNKNFENLKNEENDEDIICEQLTKNNLKERSKNKFINPALRNIYANFLRIKTSFNLNDFTEFNDFLVEFERLLSSE